VQLIFPVKDFGGYGEDDDDHRDRHHIDTCSFVVRIRIHASMTMEMTSHACLSMFSMNLKIILVVVWIDMV
jgi:hypothetical protein